MFSSSCNLKYYKRENTWQNSTKTCRLKYNNDGNLVAYSYGQQLLKTIENEYYFNDYKFSVTTSGHQSTLRYEIRKKTQSKINYVSVDSLNNITTKKELIDAIFNLYDIDSLDYNSEFIKENCGVEEFQRYEKIKEVRKEKLKLEKSLDRTRENVKNLK
jgi:hypothetical protein